MLRFKTFIVSKNLNEDNEWTQIGQRLGSNPGGLYRNSEGTHYVKFYKNPEQARTEVAASKIYNRLGIHTLNPELKQVNGKEAVVTKWRTDLRPMGHSIYNNPKPHQKHQLAKTFLAGVLTKNWDAVGLENDNLMHDEGGNIHSVDLGGTFKFRAMGGPKEYGPDIAEHKSLRDPKISAYGHHAFGGLDHNTLKAAADEVTRHSHKDILGDFKSAGVSNPEEHASSYMARAHALRQHYGLTSS